MTRQQARRYMAYITRRMKYAETQDAQEYWFRQLAGNFDWRGRYTGPTPKAQ